MSYIFKKHSVFNYIRLFTKASRAGNLNLVNQLIAANSDLDVQNAMGQSALLIGNLNLFLIFIDQNCIRTLVFLATINNNFDIVNVLVNAKANLNLQDSNGNTALLNGIYVYLCIFNTKKGTFYFKALININGPIASLLVTSGADVTIQNYLNESPLIAGILLLILFVF